MAGRELNSEEAIRAGTPKETIDTRRSWRSYDIEVDSTAGYYLFDMVRSSPKATKWNYSTEYAVWDAVKLYTLKRALHTSEIGIAIPRVMGRRPVV